MHQEAEAVWGECKWQAFGARSEFGAHRIAGSASLRRRGVFAFVALFLTACGSSPSDGAGLDDAGLDDAGRDDAGLDDAGSRPLRIGVNDVSYLFPLPGEGGEVSQLLGLDVGGEHGPLLPRTLFDAHIQRLWEGGQQAMGYDASRVIALRIDPCGGQTVVEDPSTCHAEVRLSAQPLLAPTYTVDAAIHLIYRLPRPELDAMLVELLALRGDESTDMNAPLGPHPVMTEQGLMGPFARGLMAVITSHTGVDRLVKFTFMRRGRNSDNWTFEHVERTGDTFAALPIPAAASDGSDGLVQLVGENGTAGRRSTSFALVDPAIGYPTELRESESAQGLSNAQQQAALDRLASFEDPARFSALTLDCASCHLNTNARGFFEQLFSLTAQQSFAAPEGQNTTRVDETELAGNVLVAFGYFDDRVVVSQRVINESARVANWLARDAL